MTPELDFERVFIRLQSLLKGRKQKGRKFKNFPSPSTPKLRGCLKMEKFVEQQRRLLQLEKDWEWQENSSLLASMNHGQLQRIGRAILNLVIVNQFAGFGGKMHVEFASAIASSLPATKIRTGDVVKVESYEDKEESCQGTVTKLHGNSLVICVQNIGIDSDKLVNSGGRYKVFQIPNDVSFKRYEHVLNTLEKGISNQICARSLFVKLDATPIHTFEIKFYNSQLDSSQQEAVKRTLATQPLALIHGPPGTGKTMTLIEIILQLVCPTNPILYGEGQRGNKILVCGPSNISVDNLIERLDPYASNLDIRLIRTGQPARILDSTLKHSLDSQLRKCGQGEIIDGLRREINQLVIKLFVKKEKVKNKKEQLDLLRALRKDIKERETKTTKELIFSHSHSTVVFSTLTGVGAKIFHSDVSAHDFDYVIIDESTQALEVECWIAMTRAKRGIILAGDHHQLPPTVTCPEAINKGLERTCFNRVEKTNPHLIIMLNIQYRMNQQIMQFSSNQFYKGKLECAPSVRDIRLEDFAGGTEVEDMCTFEPLIWIDTQHLAGARETSEMGIGIMQDSKKNLVEAKIALNRVQFLLSKVALQPQDVAILSPYNAQVALISELLASENIPVEVGTVDGFQGREKEVIIFSAVRSNQEREIGFLSDYRRLNVAITRAKRQLVIIGDCQTLNIDPLFKNLMDYVEIEGIFEYPDEGDFD